MSSATEPAVVSQAAVADGPHLDIPSRQGALQESSQAHALGGAGGHEVEELLVAVAVQNTLPAPRDLLLETRAQGVVGNAQGYADEAVGVHLLQGHVLEDRQDRRDLVVVVSQDVISLDGGGVGGHPRQVDGAGRHVAGDAVGQVAGREDLVAAVDEDRPGEDDAVVEVDAQRRQDVAGGEGGLAGVHGQEVAGGPPAGHGLAVGRGDGAVEDDGGVQVGDEESGHTGSLLLEGCGGRWQSG